MISYKKKTMKERVLYLNISERNSLGARVLYKDIRSAFWSLTGEKK